ncbi:MAG: 16S rRNA (cytosine(1402)-N(4))-methyltransferase RsmH [Rickettsiales bacterium]|nr:16S rRNA (cytosine(1402)-N(4))-methyltransferase RsmH [Rickettsiales bacterium]
MVKRNKLDIKDSKNGAIKRQVCDHIPVLLNEVLSLATNNPKVIVDGTFGNGGYSRALLEKFRFSTLYAFDRDENTFSKADKLKKEFGSRFNFIHDTFSNIPKHVKNPDFVILDIGVSSMQIDQGERGFSLQNDGPLDMRMGLNEIDAKTVVNEFASEQLYEIFKKYGEEPASGMIANRIVKLRAIKPIETTLELKAIIDQTARNAKAHSRVFQALRIFINDELGQLETALDTIPQILNKDGIFGTVSFHSLEDRMVKNKFNELTKDVAVSRYVPSLKQVEKDFILLTKSAIKPSKEEMQANPRSHSARLRAIRKKV